MAKYQKLVEPFKIGNVELRNRFVMLPMTWTMTRNGMRTMNCWIPMIFFDTKEERI